MQSRLKERLQAYLVEHHPDLLSSLQSDFSVGQFLEDKVGLVMPTVLKLLSEDKPGHAIEELALREMTTDLRPSRYDYIKNVLAIEFSADHHRFATMGVLSYECINLIGQCKEVFDAFEFSEANEKSQLLRHAIIARVHDCLN